MLKQIIFSVLIITTVSSCHSFFGNRVHGNGNVITETRSAGNFTGIDVSGAVDVYITQDNSFSVKVETDENLQQYIITEVRGDNVLRIKQEDNTSLETTRLKVYVSAPLYKGIEISGACKVYGQNDLTNPEGIDIDMSGASKLVLNVNSPKVNAGLSGASYAELGGQTKELILDGSGSSDFKCFNLIAENVSVGISGAGNAEVSASVKLDVEVSGAANIKYKGNPAIDQNISGAGSVKRMD
ncbi:MAG: head GIN domain-containing protein [Chitinophagaceae bacterium]